MALTHLPYEERGCNLHFAGMQFHTTVLEDFVGTRLWKPILIASFGQFPTFMTDAATGGLKRIVDRYCAAGESPPCRHQQKSTHETR